MKVTALVQLEIDVPEEFWFPDVEPFLQALQEQHGVAAYVLSCQRADPDNTTYVVMPTDAPAAPPASEWTEAGWYAEALPWIDEHISRTGPPVQVRVWGLSNVLRVPTADGLVYFKAHAHSSTLPPAKLPLLFAHEPLLLTSLEGPVPRPLAIDENRVWMLLPDLGSSLEAEPEIATWIDAVQSHARLQRSYVGRVDHLLEISCVDRRLAVLAAELDDLLGDNPATTLLEPDERAGLPTRRAELRAAIAELAAIGIPETLLHGDLHPGNLAVREGQVLAFDWTDAAVSHPFLDMVTFIHEKSPLSHDPQVRDAYLAEWTDYAPMTDLSRALALAEQIGALHQVATSLHLAANLSGPDRESMLRGATWWLRQVVNGTAR
ncbi:aminoglycoside phosphotransferase family protein [Kribbella sp. NBC_01505]|uniref:phosphotransferase family protein n=1 Tax=Kribbella sp. NBC_01505 TaxID=2903580 RepID=UPI00386F8803